MCTYISVSIPKTSDFKKFLRVGILITYLLTYLFIFTVCSMLLRASQASYILCACLYVCRPAEEPTTWGGYLGKVLMASTTYLPSQVTEMFTQGRAFATVRLPFCGHKNICALAV